MTEFNKSTTIGLSLIESLNEMVKEGTLTEQAASAIQDNFCYMYPRLLDQVLSDPVCKKPIVATVEGKLLTYNNLSSLWRIDAIESKMLPSKSSLHDSYKSHLEANEVAAAIACGLRKSSDWSKTNQRLCSEAVDSHDEYLPPDSLTRVPATVDLGIASILLNEEIRVPKKKKQKMKGSKGT